MTRRRRRNPPPPLDEAGLNELALVYVGRFATTRAKLRAYLGRKVRERGWSGERAPDLESVAERCASQGYIDEPAFALAKAQALTGRGYGKRRLVERLRVAGVEEEDSIEAREHADREAVAAALRFAQRRRIGPFAPELPDIRGREKAIAAMVRAGHGFAIARALAAAPPGAEPDVEELAQQARLSDV